MVSLNSVFLGIFLAAFLNVITGIWMVQGHRAMESQDTKDLVLLLASSAVFALIVVITVLLFTL